MFPASRPLFACLILSLCVQPARAERFFVGVMEADSYQNVIFGASAFSRVADLPIVLELLNGALTKSMALPSLSGISPNDRVRIIRTVDPAQPLSETNPADVAILPLAGSGSDLLAVFSEAYKKQSRHDPYTLFESPSDTNLLPRVSVALSGRHALTSVSEEALAWAWKNRSQLIEAPSQDNQGTLRFLVNPQRFAELLGARSDSKSNSLIRVDKLVNDFETLSFALSFDGQALSVTANGQPKAKTPLDLLAASLRKPGERYWNALPDNAFFAALSAGTLPDAWAPYLGNARVLLLRPASGLVPPAAFGDERVTYLSPTPSKRGMCLVQVEPVSDEPAVRHVIQKLHTLGSLGGMALSREQPRRSGDLLVETYTIDLNPSDKSPRAGSAQAEPSTLFTVMSLFLKQAVLEAAVTNGHLITVVGPRNTLETQLSNLSFDAKPLTLLRKISVQSPSLGEGVTAGAALKLASLLRHIVSIMPGVKPEHMRVFPLGGDGASFGVSRDTNQRLTASLRFETNEIAALQRINRDGREVLQELFFQMFTQQMMNLQAPAPAAPYDKP